MASALANQLQQLREAGGGSKRRTDTFLYEQREAARLDDETVYNLAWNGLLELKQLDARFEELDADTHVAKLFSRQRIHFHRSLITEKDAKELNTALDKVLDALSSYFLLGATHKVIEFLVRRYEIHRYNIDAVMSMIIAYHESSWFVRMVRILHIRNTRWEFMLGVKTQGTPLLRAALVQRAIDESSVIDFVFNAAVRLGASHAKLTSLYTLVVLQILEHSKVSDPMLRWLIPQLLTALKSTQFPELQSSACMIVTKLAAKATLTGKVVDALVKSLLKHAQSGAQLNALLCAIFLAQTQPSFHISTRAGKHLVHMDNFVDYLRHATSKYDSAKFIRLLTVFLTQQMNSTHDGYFNLLTALIESVSIVDELTDLLVQTLIQQAKDEAFATDNARVQAISQTLVALCKKNASKVDAAISIMLSEQAKKSKIDKDLNKFISKTFGSVANSAHFVPSTSDSSTSLALALDHPTEHIRYQALVSLAEMNDVSVGSSTGNNQVLTCEDILVRRLLDDSKRIARFVVSSSLGDLLLNLSIKQKVLVAAVQAIRKWISRGDALMVEAIVDFALKTYRSGDNLLEIDENMLTFFVSLVEEEKSVVSVKTVWSWITALDHTLVASGSRVEVDTIADVVKILGHNLAANLPTLLPFCARWTQTSDFNDKCLSGFLFKVLSAARIDLTTRKAKSKKIKEQQLALDRFFLQFLKKEFAMSCEDEVSKDQVLHASVVATKLTEVAYDTFRFSRDEFDECVALLLQSPIPIFIRNQKCLLELFHTDLETQLLPTMARIVTKFEPASDILTNLAKTRSLDIISAVLEGFTYTETDEELYQLVQIVPVVIATLADPSKVVRQSAVTCLDRWVVSCGSAVKNSNSSALNTLQKASEFFLLAKQDILMDAHSLASLCGSYIAQEDSMSFNQLLMNFVTSASGGEMCIVVKLLELLAPVKKTSFWLRSVNFFHQTVAEVLASGTDTASEMLLVDFLGHYLDADVAVAKTEQGKDTVPKEFLDAVVAVLRTDKEAVINLQKLQLFIAGNLTAQVYCAFDDVSRHVLVDRLLSLLIVAEEALASKLISCLNALPIGYNVFVRLLEEQLIRQNEDRTGLNCVLEVLAIKVDSVSSSEIADADISKLLSTLCDVLAVYCDAEREKIVSDYILQVLFGCLRRVCEVTVSSTMSTTENLDKVTKCAVAVKPEFLVKHTLTCLSRTTSPQTRNEALLFISSLVDLHPVSVLTSLNEILRFVSHSLILQEDEYSFHILETIIKAVVPHIVAAKRHDSSALITPQQFIAMFVIAFHQIPKSKREALFVIVVKALGSDFLAYCTVALLQSAALDEDTDLQREWIQFAHILCFYFTCVEQVSSLVMIVRMIRDLLPHVTEEADTDTDELDEDEDDVVYEDFILDDRLVKSPLLCRRLNTILVKFVAAHLRARELHHKILNYEKKRDQSVDDVDDNMLQQNYLMLAQLDLLYFRRVAKEQSLHDDVSGFWTSLASDSMEMLGALQQLLSTPGFVAVITELLHHDNSLVRKKAMQLFNERLQEEHTSLSSGEVLLFIDMLDELDTILQNSENCENSVNIQTALLSVDILARNFASRHIKRFQQILPTIVKYVDQNVNNAPPMTLHLFGCAFVCLSSICRAIGPVILPLLPKFFPRLLSGIDYCTASHSIDGTKSVLQCLLIALEIFTDKIYQFLGPYLPAVIRALLTPSLLSTSPANAAVLMLVDSCFVNLCNHVELRQLLSTLFGAYEHVLTLENDTSVTRLFSVVGTVVNKLNLSVIRKHLPSFARFFVTALDARRVHASKLKDLDRVEEEMLDCFVQFILKLSEKQLKPLFLKLVEWAQTRIGSSRKESNKLRWISFFKLVSKLSERLRGIFVPYYAHFLEFSTLGLVESRKVLLQKPPLSAEDGDSDDDDFFVNEDDLPAKKRKLDSSIATNATTDREQNLLLLTTIVRALDGCFMHDNDGFIEKEQFDMVLTPLVDVLDILQHDSTMRQFILDVVAPCLANLAWAARSDLLWKPLHYAVLMKSRGNSALVRLAALVTVEKCYQVIGDEFLAMLPESIPFLAELMEDTNEEVERTCHRVIKQIEDISGESLDQYLTT
ncbi:putative U3 small nucleolar RNA-associated protein [Plasmopara halstedii]